MDLLGSGKILALTLQQSTNDSLVYLCLDLISPGLSLRSLITFAGTPAANTLSGVSLVITALTPIRLPRPILTPAAITA